MKTSRLYFLTIGQIREEMYKITDEETLNIEDMAHLIDSAVALLKTTPLSEISGNEKIKNYEELCKYTEVLYKNAMERNRKYTSKLAHLLFICKREKCFFESKSRG